MKKLTYLSLLFVLIISTTQVKSQLIANHGQLIYSQKNAIIKVEGSVLNDSGIIDHNGYIVIDSSFIQNTAGQTSGNGIYDVYVNWNNSGVFTHDSSVVNLTGTNQLITGTAVTDFWNLNLTGPGIKTQTINSETSNILNLYANELATDSFEMLISNRSVSAILYDNTFQAEGFVSSLGNGRLTRLTNSNNVYVFPLGSSVGTTRFRAVHIQPTVTTNESYSSLLVNYNASLDGYNTAVYDSTICQVNTLFYHKVEGSAPADLKIHYNNNLDGYWDGQAWWNNSWVSTDTIFQTQPLTYWSVTKTAHNFNFAPIVLSNPKPKTPLVTGDTAICPNNIAYYTINTPGQYDWIISSGNGTIISGQGTNSIGVEWYNTPGIISVVNVNQSSGCHSDTVHFMTSFLPLPVAGIEDINPNTFYPNQVINLNDSSTGATSWNWDFGNGYFDNNQNTQTTYFSNGNYWVTLTVENQYGCTDTSQIEIIIGGEVFIANVITPNNDGSNDYFTIKGLDEYQVIILNRWGQTLYEGNEKTRAWDGTTLSGEKVPNGTYFYVLTADNMEQKGTISVLY